MTSKGIAPARLNAAAKALAPAFAPWTDASQKPLVQLENVTKRFGDFTAIDTVSLDIYEREFFAILGPSGCGKTTIMRMLAGFEDPSEGRVTLDGVDLAGTPPNKRPVNMMFQSYALFPHLTVAQNIAFGLKRDGLEKGEIDARLDQMLGLVQLTEFAARKPHQLSGGQRQRVALARSLAKRPRLLLLDEPLGALDKKLRQETQFELMEIQETLGATFVIVTHDQEEAMTVSSRIAVMNRGVLAQVAPPAEVYELPDSRFVASFIGDVTILETTIEAAGEGIVTLGWRAGHAPFRAASERPVDLGQKVGLALRPEKVEISKEKPSDAVNAVQGEVIDIAYLGNVSMFHVKLESGDYVQAQTSNRRRLALREITWEDRVWLSWGEDSGVVLTE